LEPPEAGSDDLKLIKGIGPQNEARLNALGIHRLDQIAAWTAAEAQWVGSYLAFPGRIEREDWIGQAKALIAGTNPQDLRLPPRRPR
jgi:NADH-quinone oxidoreductase subunit E